MREENERAEEEALGLTMILRAVCGDEVGSKRDAAAKATNDMVFLRPVLVGGVLLG
jgi:hypothetical protein